MVKMDEMTREQILRKVKELRNQVNEFRKLEKERKKAEEALKDREEKYRNLFENAAIGMYRTKLDGSAVLAVNKKLAEIVGMSTEEILSNPAFIHCENPAKRDEMVRQLTQTGSILDYEIRLVDKNGEIKTCVVSGKVFKGEGTFEGSLVDITERKKAEEALKASETRYRRLFETAQDGILLLDANTGQITDINPYLVKLLGYPSQELLGKQLWEIGPFKDVVASKTVFKKLQEEQYVRYDDLPLETKEGKSIAVEFVSNVYLVDGRKVIQCNIRDITGRKNAEYALKESENRYKSLFESTREGIMVSSPDGRVMYSNPAAVKMLGYESTQDIVGVPANELYYNPEQRNILFKKLMEKGSAKDVEIIFKKKDGILVYVLGSVTLQKDIEGNLIRGEAIFTDITERKKAEEERERLYTELGQINKELEDIIYITSHDLRSPLVNVQGFSRELCIAFEDVLSILQSKDIPKDVEKKISTIIERDILESLQFITTSIAKMDSLLSGVLKISRLGRVELKKGQLNMNKMISEIKQSYQFQIDQANAHLETSELPGCYGDEMQINQVFSNLVGNSLKYFDPNRTGSIKISGHEEKGQSIYCIEDNGIGIAPEYKNNIFDMFHQLEPGERKGEGLGLTIVRKIVEKHDGNVWVESEPGKGSKFFVSIPGNEKFI